MSKEDEVLLALASLTHEQRKVVVEALTKDLPSLPNDFTDNLMLHLPNLPARLTSEDIINNAMLRKDRCYFHIVDATNTFETVVAEDSVTTTQDAVQFAYKDPLQPWYWIQRPKAQPDSLVKSISHEEYCDWLKRE